MSANSHFVDKPFFETLPDDAKVYNFAYGANLCESSIKSRKLEPIESIPCKLVGYELSFSAIGLPLVEPQFGDITKASDNVEMHGVCHLLTKTGWRRLQTTEGGGGIDRRGYIPTKVTCVAYDGRKIEAYALMIEMPTKQHFYVSPSERYVKKIINGARKFGLHPQYIAELEKQPVTVKNLFGILFMILLAVLFSPVIVVLLLFRIFAKKSRIPQQIIRSLMVFSWWLCGPFCEKLPQPVKVSIPITSGNHIATSNSSSNNGN